MFGLKKPLPKMITPSATYKIVFASSRFVEKIEALVKRSNCPIPIRVPPNKIQFLLPKNLSEMKPPNIGVK